MTLQGCGRSIPPMSDPAAPKVSLLIASIVTVALLSGWIGMYVFGLFEKTGNVVMLATLGTDITVIAAFWYFAMRNDLNGKP